MAGRVECGQCTRIHSWLQENFEGQEWEVSVWHGKLTEVSRLVNVKTKLLGWIKEWHRSVGGQEGNRRQ